MLTVNFEVIFLTLLFNMPLGQTRISTSQPSITSNFLCFSTYTHFSCVKTQVFSDRMDIYSLRKLIHCSKICPKINRKKMVYVITNGRKEGRREDTDKEEKEREGERKKRVFTEIKRDSESSDHDKGEGNVVHNIRIHQTLYQDGCIRITYLWKATQL